MMKNNSAISQYPDQPQKFWNAVQNPSSSYLTRAELIGDNWYGNSSFASYNSKNYDHFERTDLWCYLDPNFTKRDEANRKTVRQMYMSSKTSTYYGDYRYDFRTPEFRPVMIINEG